MENIDALVRQVVRAFRPSKALLERLKAGVCAPRTAITVVFVSENSRAILQEAFRRNQKLFRKIQRK